MKKVFFVALLALSTSISFSQDEETLLGGVSNHSGYGAVVFKVASVNGASAVLFGGKGYWVINHALGIGGGGYGLETNVDTHDPDASGGKRLRMGYGGVALEYTTASNDLFHVTFEALIGGGGVSNGESISGGPNRDWDSFFIAEPGVNVDLNVMKYFRLGVGASYRVVLGLSSTRSTNSDLSGPSAVLTFKFGVF